MSRLRDWRVVLVSADGHTSPAIYYGSRYTALKGALWHARTFPNVTVRVQRRTTDGSFTGFTETRGSR